MTLQGNSIVLHLHLDNAFIQNNIAFKVCILPVYAISGNRTDGLGIVCAILYWLSYKNIFNVTISYHQWNISFSSHISKSKKKKKLGFYFRNKLFLIQCTVRKSSCPVLNYGDVVCQFCSFLSSSLDVVYHGALRFIPDCISSAHHCVL